MDFNALLQALVEHGFVGLAATLLGILVWLVGRLLSLLEGTNRVIDANTHAIQNLDGRLGELVRLTGEVRDRLLARPCIAEREGR